MYQIINIYLYNKTAHLHTRANGIIKSTNSYWVKLVGNQ